MREPRITKDGDNPDQPEPRSNKWNVSDRQETRKPGHRGQASKSGDKRDFRKTSDGGKNGDPWVTLKPESRRVRSAWVVKITISELMKGA